MEATKRNQLGTKLKEMLNAFLKEETRRNTPPIPQSGTGNVIRRREGQKEKRFSLACSKSDPVAEQVE
jgi:hypothetical protein